MILFDGKGEAAYRKTKLQEEFKKYPQTVVFSLVFQEDKPSIIYSNLKKKDAEFVGIQYEVQIVPIATPLEEILHLVKSAAERPEVKGIIIQKPEKSLLLERPQADWWETVVTAIPPLKDIDGLVSGSGVVPATARAIMEIVNIAQRKVNIDLGKEIGVMVGRGAIVGKPVYEILKKKMKYVHLFGRKEFAEKPEILAQAGVVISATGQENLIKANMLKYGVITIDAGSPKPEIDPTDLDSKASFISPVPGGVGPMTRVCLLENLLDLLRQGK